MPQPKKPAKTSITKSRKAPAKKAPAKPVAIKAPAASKPKLVPKNAPVQDRDTSYSANKKDQEQVEILCAGNMSNREIALVLEISEATLVRCYGLTLETSRAVVRARMIEATYRAAMAGNTTAQKRMLEMTDALPIPSYRRPKIDKPPPEPKKERIGKKEAIVQEAAEQTKTGEWAELLTDPPQVVN